MDARDNIATDLFYKIRSRFSGLKLGAETGQITINPSEARFFDFDYMEGEQPLGHVSISLAEPNSMKVYFSTGITESMDGGQKDKWYGFLRELRQFAKRRLMSFDTRDIAKDMLDKRDYEFLSQNSKEKTNLQATVGESIMSESTLYGSRTMSYQKLMDTRLIIKHSKAVMDDLQPGARTRNISALFVENQDGERFKYPFIHLAGARAMQRHVANGGLPYDDIGKSIVQMSEEIAQLKSFSNYVVRNDLMNSDTNGIVERGQHRLESLREQIKAMSKQSHYEAYRENFQAQEQAEVPEEVVEDFVEKFTIKNFKEDIKSVFPVLYRLMQEENTIGYDDIVAMTQEDVTEDEEQEEAYDPFEKFEAWAMNLGEESTITSKDPEEQAQAVKELQALVGEHFPAGVDGTNAIESLKGIIEDPQLYKEIKDKAKEDPDGCVRPLVKDWLEQNAPEVVDQLDFGDMVDEPAAAQGGEQTAPEEEPQMAGDDPDKRNKDDKDDIPFEPDENPTDKDEFGNTIKHKARHLARKGMRQAMDVKELAEFINSFYDRNTGTFPKGPEGVCTMVGKKFGEQAEQVARKFVERMAPHQEAGAEQMQELARIRELAGMPGNDMAEDSEERIKFRGTDHDIGEERYAFAVDGNPIVFNFPSDEDNPDPDSPSFEEILAKVQRDGAVEHFRITPEEQRAMAEKIADERQKYLDQRQQEEGVAEGTGTEVEEFFEKVAQKGDWDMLHDAQLGKYGPKIEKAVQDMYNDVATDRGFHPDDDFEEIYDMMLNWIETDYGSKKEMEDIRRLSGIAQGLGY